MKNQSTQHMGRAAIATTVLMCEVEEVINVLNAAGHVVMILREEDNLLRSNGLSRKMPHGWEWGDDPFARYNSSRIKLSKTRILMKGIICRKYHHCLLKKSYFYFFTSQIKAQLQDKKNLLD